jgi:hypothetical protein
MQAFRLILILGMVLLGCGCGSKQDSHRPKVHPVSGKIVVVGRPAVGAQVILYEKDQTGKNANRPHGKVGTDGVFHLTTFTTNDGAPDGEYALTVTWPSPPVKGQGEDEEGPDHFAKRYADYRRPAAQVKITSETSELAPLELK